MIKIFLAIILCVSTVFAGPIDVYFAPDGGFSEKNKSRTIVLPSGEEVKATLSNGLRDMIMRTEDYGKIKICMYAMGDLSVVDDLIEAAGERGIQVKLLLDACADWTEELRQEILEKIEDAEKSYAEKDKRFDFQLKYITKKNMEDRGRTRVIEEEGEDKTIYGTMHEKFGVFYTRSSKIPYDCFAGSSNVSYGSDQIFAENRIFFHDRPAVARQFQKEFARLWNEYGEAVSENCTSEMYVPAYPVPGDVRVVFNGEPITEDKYYRIDKELEDIIEQVYYSWGSVDVAMFSFTHKNLANALVEYARRMPKAKFRILLDQSQMANTESHRGVMGPWFEDQIKEHKLENMEVRYKWRSNAYGAEDIVEGKKPEIHLVHWRNYLLHHKVLIVNKKVLAAGSYNWSASAEKRNLENIMIFEKNYRGHEQVVDRFLYEYDAIWNAEKSNVALEKPVDGPQSVSGPQGRTFQRKIVSLLEDVEKLEIRDLIEKKKNITLDKMKELSGLSKKKLKSILEDLVKATLICKQNIDDEIVYSLAD